MRRDTHPASDDSDLATRQHQVVVLDRRHQLQGAAFQRLTSSSLHFTPDARAGAARLRRARLGTISAGARALVLGGQSVGDFPRAGGAPDEPKRDLTDAEEIAQLLRSGVVSVSSSRPGHAAASRLG